MKLGIRRLYNESGSETGAVLSVVIGAGTTIQQKAMLENRMINYAFTTLYPGEGLNICREIHNDTPSITVIRGINDLPSEEVNVA